MNDVVIITSKGEIITKDYTHTLTLSGQCTAGWFYIGSNIALMSGTGTSITATVTKCVGNTLYLRENKCQPMNTAVTRANTSGKRTTRSKLIRRKRARRAKQKQ